MTAAWTIRLGQKVLFKSKIYEVSQILDLKSILARNTHTGIQEKIAISELKFILPVSKPSLSISVNPDDNQQIEEIHLKDVIEKDWEEARRRASSIKRLLELSKITVSDVEKEADFLGVSRATVYRYLNKYLAVGKTSALIPNVSDGGRGKTRIYEKSETILREAINEFYLTRQSPKVQQVITEYKRLCYNAGVTPAHDNTVRNRIKEILEIESVSKRQGRDALRRYLPVPGKFPEGKFPLEVVQIDHTPIDLQFVDDITRLSIGRFYLTVAIDVYSRMILGFYISPDEPSITSVGMCLTHAILPKESELIRLGIDKEWNCWGIMNKIHADNAGEFRGYDLLRACEEYGIDLEWRPVAKPHYGPHIERLLETFMEEVHTLPGTTFSNIQQKGNYDSEEEAAFTLSDFEKWLTVYIIGVYHKRVHNGIGMPPEVKFERGIFVGDDQYGPVGLPPRITDELKLRIDFMPTIERTIQQFGVEIDFVRYYDSVLNPYIGSKDPNNEKRARKFIFKRNPRSIGKIYFYHPDLKQYFEIPYRNLRNPDANIREYNAAKKKLKESGVKVENEDQIFGALNEMRNIRDNAIDLTKKARREIQRQRIYQEQNERYGLNGKSIPKQTDNQPNNREIKNSKYPQSWSAIYDTPEDELPPLEIDEDY